MRTRQRTMRSVRQPRDRALQIPTDPAMQGRAGHPRAGGDLNHTLPGQHRPDRVQPLLNNTQDNQRHPGPLTRNDAPRKASTTQDCRVTPRTVAHQVAQNCRASAGTGQSDRQLTAESGSIEVKAALRAVPAPRRARSACPRFAAGRYAGGVTASSSTTGGAGNTSRTVSKLSPWTASGATWPVSRNPSFSRTRRDAAFQSRTPAHNRR
jgi:hypothetical protein